VQASKRDILAQGALLADDRVLCPGCVGQLETLPSWGPYRLLRRIGSGGYGVVLKALHVQRRRIVVVKKVALAGNPDAAMTGRLLREIGFTREFEHPHIVKLHDASTDGQTFYLVMDYIDGRDLAVQVRADGGLPLREAARLAREVGGALDYAHRSEVAHRDVKPENVIIALDGKAMLTDFGLARGIDDAIVERVTPSGFTVGTPLYMAPEQFEGARHAASPADVYGFAATLFFAVVGRAPFEHIGGGSIRELYQAIRNDPMPDVARIRQGFPPEATAALARGLHRDPSRRFATAGELADAFARPLEAMRANG